MPAVGTGDEWLQVQLKKDEERKLKEEAAARKKITSRGKEKAGRSEEEGAGKNIHSYKAN